jgi:hypothetical protein
VKVLSLGLVFLAGLFCLSNALVPARSMTLDTQASAKAELLALHQAARRAHLNRDVDFIVAGMGTEFTTVHEGKVKVMSRDDVRKQFTEYFCGAEFSAWDDLEPPIIQVSPDGKNGLDDRPRQDRVHEDGCRGREVEGGHRHGLDLRL